MDNEPKLIINSDVSMGEMQSKSQEEQEFLDLLNEVGKQGVIDLAINLVPGRDFSKNPLSTAKDVICNLYANGGQESVFLLPQSEGPINTGYTEQDKISMDC